MLDGLFPIQERKTLRPHPQSLDGEVWREIEGYPRYLVSNLGRVFSTIRMGRLLKPTIGTHGYPYVSLMAGGASRGTKVLLHRLVAGAFVDGRGETVNHKDGDKTNCRDTNLEWASYAENNEHARDTGLSSNYGSSHRNAKLTPENVEEIRRRAASGEYRRCIAADFGVGRRAIDKIANGEAWRRVR
jgi:hypothetical protein